MVSLREATRSVFGTRTVERMLGVPYVSGLPQRDQQHSRAPKDKTKSSHVDPESTWEQERACCTARNTSPIDRWYFHTLSYTVCPPSVKPGTLKTNKPCKKQSINTWFFAELCLLMFIAVGVSFVGDIGLHCRCASMWLPMHLLPKCFLGTSSFYSY